MTSQKHSVSAGLEDFCVEIWAGSNVFGNCNSSAGFLFSCYPGGPWRNFLLEMKEKHMVISTRTVKEIEYKHSILNYFFI